MEVEEVVKVVGGALVGHPEVAQSEDSFDCFQYAAKVIVEVADVSRLGGIGRNHKQRHTETELIVVLVRAFLEDGTT